MGLVVGAIALAVGWVLESLGTAPPITGAFVLLSLIVVTGAMHEDGLADCADGFWGGWDVARRLEIMKDSQTGTYGILALILVTGLRWVGYAALLPANPWTVIAVAILSRAGLPCLMAALPHARTSGLSHSTGRPSALLALAGIGCAVLLAGLCIGALAVGGLLATLAAPALVGAVAQRKIGGQTGDVLGAAQQISEITIVAVVLVLLQA